MEPCFGINFPHVAVELMKDTADRVASYGYDLAEYCLSDHPLIVGGKISRPYVEYVGSIFKKAPIRFTAHIGTGLDLRNTEDHALHKSTLFSSVDVCEMLDMRTLTVHYEGKSMHYDVERAFVDAHCEAAEYAQKKGVLICIENIEIDHYQNVLDMLKSCSHPNLKLTLDIGHLNLSTNFFSQGFLEAVKECAPYTAHLHISDNTGHFEKLRLTNFLLYSTLPMGPRIALGSGDIHLPPFWGEIDITGALEILKDSNYDGIFLCEYYSHLYNPFNEEIQKKIRKTVNEIFG